MNKQTDKESLQLRVLKAKRDLRSIGIHKYPTEEISLYCTLKKKVDIINWNDRVQNCWHLKSTNEKTTEIFEKLYIKLEKVHGIEVINPKTIK